MPRTRILAGIFCVSAATLSLEVNLTRYFSIAQDYHFAFWVISIAFLGYGASGSFLSLWKGSVNRNLDSLLVANRLHFDIQELAWSESRALLILVIYVIWSLPFFFAGLTISTALSRLAAQAAKIYSFDLAGAAAGSILAVTVFLPRGEPGVFPLLSLLAGAASLLFYPKKAMPIRVLPGLWCLGLAAAMLFAPRFLDFRISPFKALPVALKYPGSKAVLTRWNSLSRVDVLESPAARFAPGLSLVYDKDLPPQLGLSLDGGDLNAVTSAENLDDPRLEFLSFLPSSLPYIILEKPRTLVIEPKGGLDVLAALYHGADSVKAYEDNPLLARLMKKDLNARAAHLYTNPRVALAVANSRTSLKKEQETFDLIVFSLTDVVGSMSTGLYGFHENYLCTAEAFGEMLDKLTEKGIIGMTVYQIPPPRQEIRLLASWIDALAEKGKDPAARLLVLRSWGTMSFFIKSSPFTPDEIGRAKGFAGSRLFDLDYYPGVKEGNAEVNNKALDPLYQGLTQTLLDPEKRERLYREYLFDVRPVDDNRPFFAGFYKWDRMKQTYIALGRKWLPLLQGPFMLLFLIAQAGIAASGLIIAPVMRLRRDSNRSLPRRRKTSLAKVFLYFFILGGAFIGVEIALIQRFILFLGHPLYSVAGVLFSLLLATGAGSFFSRKIPRAKLVPWSASAIILCAVLVFLMHSILPVIFEGFLGVPLLIRGLIVFALISPLGFFMGIPFPSGIRLLSEEKEIVPWAWASNSFSTVINSVAAFLAAVQGGYSFLFLLAGAGYLAALPFLGFAHHRDEPDA
jgi:hypothetical protein